MTKLQFVDDTCRNFKSFAVFSWLDSNFLPEIAYIIFTLLYRDMLTNYSQVHSSVKRRIREQNLLKSLRTVRVPEAAMSK